MTCAGRDIDYAVAIVGFDDARGAWIIKNSWGTDFEYDGFYLVRYGSCGIGVTHDHHSTGEVDYNERLYAVKEVKKI